MRAELSAVDPHRVKDHDEVGGSAIKARLRHFDFASRLPHALSVDALVDRVMTTLAAARPECGCPELERRRGPCRSTCQADGHRLLPWDSAISLVRSAKKEAPTREVRGFSGSHSPAERTFGGRGMGAHVLKPSRILVETLVAWGVTPRRRLL